MLSLYAAEVDGTRVIVAGDPAIYSNESCGHLINDGAAITKADYGVEDILCYTEDSLACQNCVFVPLGGLAVAVVATRSVKKNEELLTGYGGACDWSLYELHSLKLFTLHTDGCRLRD